MKELNSFTVERLEEFIRQPLENGLTRSEQMELARIALAAKRAEPNELADAVNEFLSVLDNYPEQLVPINREAALVKDLRKALSSTPQLNSPEIPDYKSALLGLLMSCISKDHLGFFTLAGINKTNLIKAVEVSGATINFDYEPQVNIGECLIPNGWIITPEIPDGWKLVPIIAYPSQWAAGQKAHNNAGINKVDAVYKAMVAAAPDASGFDPSLPGAEATVITHYYTPDGYKLVPTELTKAMRDAWDSAPNGNEDDDVNMCNAYRAMIAAAPEKPL